MSDSLSLEKDYRDGYLYSTKCTDTSGDGDKVKTLSLAFDYEFALPNPGEPFAEVQWQDLPSVEFGMLRRMNQVTGIENCDFTAQLEDPWLQSAGSSLHRVLGLTSGEPDTLHPVGECRYINNLDNSLVCYAMRGMMDVVYTGSDAKVIEDYMLFHLRTELNAQNVLVGSISQTYFVGKSTENPYNLVAEDAKGRSANPQNSDSSTNILPLVLAVPIAIALIVAIGLFVTRRGRKSDSSELQQAETDQADESGDGGSPISSKVQPMALAETDSSEKSDDEDNFIGSPSSYSIFDDVETGSTKPAGTDDLIPMDLEAPSDRLAPTTAAKSLAPIDAENPFEVASIGVQDSALPGDVLLPPLPPGVRPARVAAVAAGQPARRRRKKKRKPVERRESVQEMATIQETPENSDNENEDSYDSGSEQSWSTDGAEEGSPESPEYFAPFRDFSTDPEQSTSFDESATLVTDNRTFIA